MAGTLKVGTITTPSGSGSITIPSGVTLSGQNYPAFHVNLNGDQTLSDATAAKIQFNREVFDTNSAFDSTTNYRFTVPSNGAGKYFIYSNILLSSSALSTTEQVIGYIYVNGSDRMQSYAFDIRNTAGNKANAILTATLDLSVGDYVEIYGYINVTSGTVKAEGARSDDTTCFGGYRIGA